MSRGHPLAAFHCEQSLGNSCLAACITMTRVRAGTVAADDAVAHERAVFTRIADRKAISYPAVTAEIGVKPYFADFDQPNTIELVKARLASLREWHIAVMSGAHLRELHARASPPPLSRHGLLPGDLGDRHAIVVAGVESNAFLVLDPWFLAEYQPWHVGFLDFMRASTGVFFPVSLPA